MLARVLAKKARAGFKVELEHHGDLGSLRHVMIYDFEGDDALDPKVVDPLCTYRHKLAR